MKKAMILLAGYPATGKTYMANQIISECGEFAEISPDTIKEQMFDEFGYDDIQEKDFIIAESWVRYYSNLRILMNKQLRIISDYPFSPKQYDQLKQLTEQSGYHVITVRLFGDLDILYERLVKRDLDSSRHPSHLLYRYYPGDTIEDRSKAEGFLSYDIFTDRCKNKGYGEFELGKLIELDVTDFSKADYSGVISTIKNIIQE